LKALFTVLRPLLIIFVEPHFEHFFLATFLYLLPWYINSLSNQPSNQSFSKSSSAIFTFNPGTSTFGLMQEIIDAKIKAASSPTSLYPPQESNLSLREAAVEFYKRVFEVPV
jgi:aspartate/methionine/tyrosine aminotransferase